MPEGEAGDTANIRPLPPTIPPEELADIGLSEELVKRYIVMKKKKALDRDPNTILCPRQWCQGPSVSSVKKVEDSMAAAGSGYWLPDLDSEPEPAAAHEAGEEKKQVKPDAVRSSQNLEKLQVCSKCSFAFCRVCTGTVAQSRRQCFPADALQHHGTATFSTAGPRTAR